MPTLSYQVVDVFTQTPFAGNPLAVVLDADGVPAEGLQALAREFHLSETAFPLRPDADGADYRLRIFTPETELPFAGHPSIGAAWVLARLGRIGPGRVQQSCGAGVLPLVIEPGPGRVELTGGTPTVGEPVDPESWLAAVGLVRSNLAGPPPRRAGTGLEFGYLPVSEAAVGRASPDLGRLRSIGCAGVSVFGWDSGRAHARVFAGDVGVPEDPATGSAALGLGAFLVAAGLAAGEGTTAYVVHQGAEIGRPSTLECTVAATRGAAVECRVAGQVVAIARGEIARP
ncbi:MAG: PhzF family phenazine biosynthesis protein [Mycobacteriales bacterium]